MSRVQLWFLPVAVVVLASVHPLGEADAALKSPADAKVTFVAVGPAGLRIEGKTVESKGPDGKPLPVLRVADDQETLTLTVGLQTLTTGIGLRDAHMKQKYLEVQRFPDALLTLKRSSLKFPPSGERTQGEATGTLALHGVEKPVVVRYTVVHQADEDAVEGEMNVKMTDYGIVVPSYLGVTVRPDVTVKANFRLRDL